MRRWAVWLACALVWAGAPARAGGWRVERVVPLPLGSLEGKGQPAAPATDREGSHLAFEFLGSDGDTLEVYLAALEGDAPLPAGLGRPVAVVPAGGADPFALRPERPLSEGPSFGPPKRGRPRVVVAATRKAATRGATVVNLDLFLREPGRRTFLTEHPENDAGPAFSPDGAAVAFTSGRTGQGDLYLYRFRGEPSGLVRLTFEPAGSELYPAWAPGGDRIAFVAHLGTSDHVVVLDRLGEFLAAGEAERPLRVAGHLRDLTPGWAGTCSAPSVSPDGRWVAFLSRRAAAGPADLYAVPIEGGEPRRLCGGVLAETRGGPRWTPDSRGFVVALDDPDRLNPLAHVPLDGEAKPRVLATATELNADPWVVRRGGRTVVVFTAQGAAGQAEKRWRRVYAALLREEGR